MQTSESLKRQIDTTEDLAVVVRTMKTLAAVNIRQYEEAADSLESYNETILDAVRMLLWNAPDLFHQDRCPPAQHIGLIVFGSDQGMCGGFNEAVADFVTTAFPVVDSSSRKLPVIALGRRLVDRLLDAGYDVGNTLDLPGSATGITAMLQDLLPLLDRWQRAHSLDAVYVCHNRRLSQTQYEPVQRTLLPVSPQNLAPQRPRCWPGKSLPLVSMPPQELWQSISLQYMFVALFHACAESQASENAARIAAMQAAETHIRDNLQELEVTYQQLRQTIITEELLDIITGFEALTGDENSD